MVLHNVGRDERAGPAQARLAVHCHAARGRRRDSEEVGHEAWRRRGAVLKVELVVLDRAAADAASAESALGRRRLARVLVGGGGRRREVVVGDAAVREGAPIVLHFVEADDGGHVDLEEDVRVVLCAKGARASRRVVPVRPPAQVLGSAECDELAGHNLVHICISALSG